MVDSSQSVLDVDGKGSNNDMTVSRYETCSVGTRAGRNNRLTRTGSCVELGSEIEKESVSVGHCQV